MPLDKPKNVANDSLKTPYVTVNNNITALGTSTFTQLSGTQTNRPTSPAIGTFYYDTTTGQTEVYTANGWVNPATAPNAPTNVTAANQAIAYGGTPAAYVYFTPATTGNPATTYTVNSNTGGFTATGTSSPISVTGLNAGTSYTFTVTATNAYGSATSSASSSLTAGTISQPPTSLTASGSYNSASIAFTAPSNTGAAPVTSYTFYSNPGNQSATVTTSPATIYNLNPAISYTFSGTANNSAGSSSLSVPSNAVNPSLTSYPPYTYSSTTPKGWWLADYLPSTISVGTVWPNFGAGVGADLTATTAGTRVDNWRSSGHSGFTAASFTVPSASSTINENNAFTYMMVAQYTSGYFSPFCGIGDYWGNYSYAYPGYYWHGLYASWGNYTDNPAVVGMNKNAGGSGSNMHVFVNSKYANYAPTGGTSDNSITVNTNPNGQVVAEFLVWDSALSDTEINTITTALRAKYSF